MKTTMKAILVVVAFGATALAVNAQDANGPQGWNNSNGPRGHRPPPNPLFMALDVNHDGVIDADEIANASAELKTLDKNGDGVLTRDEVCPPPPQRADNSSNGGQNPPDDQPPGSPPQQ
jgi:EF hand domain-containing protein